MKANWLVGLAAICAVAVCGCTPESLTTATVSSVERASLWVNGEKRTYRIGEKEHAILKDEFEKWQQEGFGGFEFSFLDYTPSMNISGTLENGTSYSVDLGLDALVVTESDEKGGSSRYERMITVADKRFFVFLFTCIREGKFPKAAQ